VDSIQLSRQRISYIRTNLRLCEAVGKYLPSDKTAQTLTVLMSIDCLLLTYRDTDLQVKED